MNRSISAGIVGGLIAGLVFGMMMHVMILRAPDGGDTSMMAMVAQIMRSNSVVVGWAYHLFNSAVIGAIFGWLLRGKHRSVAASTGAGALYGLGWWILGGLILMPMLLGMPLFAPLRPGLRMIGLSSLVGHLIYGTILGLVFGWLTRGARTASQGRSSVREAAGQP